MGDERTGERGPRRPSSPELTTWVVLGAALAGVLGLFSIRCPLGPATARSYPSRMLAAEPEPELLPTPPPDEEYYPCSDCHEGEPTDRTVRQLEEEHDMLQLAHGDLWCLDCHDVGNRDRLHLADGTLVAFERSWQLCTQCHGEKLTDWRAGVHGKRKGHWWGPKEYHPCVNCHSPHSPRFQPLKPEPPPRRPAEIALDARSRSRDAHE